MWGVRFLPTSQHPRAKPASAMRAFGRNGRPLAVRILERRRVNGDASDKRQTGGVDQRFEPVSTA